MRVVVQLRVVAPRGWLIARVVAVDGYRPAIAKATRPTEVKALAFPTEDEVHRRAGAEWRAELSADAQLAIQALDDRSDAAQRELSAQLASSPPLRRCCTSNATTAKPATHAAVTSAVPSSSGDVLGGSAADPGARRQQLRDNVR